MTPPKEIFRDTIMALFNKNLFKLGESILMETPKFSDKSYEYLIFIAQDSCMEYASDIESDRYIGDFSIHPNSFYIELVCKKLPDFKLSFDLNYNLIQEGEM